ncbi:MAG: hypothetical protein ACKVOX_07130 [Rhizobacter sp.]
MNPNGRAACPGIPWLVVALLAMCPMAWAGDYSSEKARINKAKGEADAVLAAKEAECRLRFVVNACLIEARQQHRAVVQPLHEELILLDEKQRKQRAADRTERIRAKSDPSSGAADAPAMPVASASAPVTAASRPAPRPLIRPRLRSFGMPSESPLGDMPGALSDPPPGTAAGVMEGTSAGSVHTRKRLTPMPNANALKDSNDRAQEIDERRERVLMRNAEKAAKKPPSAPLPVPGAASSATR